MSLTLIPALALAVALDGGSGSRPPSAKPLPQVGQPASAELPAAKVARPAQRRAAPRRPGAARPGAARAQAGAGRNVGGAAAGNARQLIGLIQNTVAPTTWDIRGGPGTIYYWSPGHAMAIQQTDPVHDNVSDVLNQLRRAGR